LFLWLLICYQDRRKVFWSWILSLVFIFDEILYWFCFRLVDLRFLMWTAIKIQVRGEFFWMICGVFNSVFCNVLFWLWSLINVCDVFLRERSRDDTLTVVRDRKVSPNSLTLQPLHYIIYLLQSNPNSVNAFISFTLRV
jgi:hypothetical protein